MHDPGSHRAGGHEDTNDTAERIPDGGDIAHAVISADEIGADGDIGDHRIGGVVLAAGAGERYEGPYKLLEEVDGTAMVRRAVEAMLDSELDEVLVVVGHESDAVRTTIEDLDVDIMVNDAYREGQSTSLHLGVEAAREQDWDATVFGLGDMPFVTGGAIDLVLEAYAAGHASIVAAGYDGKRGNPTLFDETYYEELLNVTGDTGGRAVLMSSSDVGVVDTGEPGVLRDIDTREDYDAVQ